MIKLSKFTLDPGESNPICDCCKSAITDEIAETSVTYGYFHKQCAIAVGNYNDPTDYMAFMDDAREYAKSKGE